MFNNAKSVLIAILLVFLLLVTNRAYAGYLTIGGIAKITTTVENGNLNLTGTYEISNRGNESAQNVFPSFELGKWSWAGDERILSPGSNEVWPIKASISLERISHKEAGGEIELPAKGRFPLIVLRHYEDVNGVKFSVADVTEIFVGSLTPEELSIAKIPQVNTTFACDGDGKTFSCLLTMRNLSQTAKKIAVSYHTSQELQLKPPVSVIDLAPHSSVSLASDVENISGLPGSGYAIFAVMQWNQNGIASEATVARIVNVREPANIMSWFIAGIVALLVLYQFIFKKIRAK